MTLPLIDHQCSPANSWQASLTLALRHKGLRTILQTVDHLGPLRVQRPFYPEGAVCHLYLLHPPGGMVAGDVLAISVDVNKAAHTLLTTPAAGKLYRVADGAPPQYQGVHAHLAEQAILEWLPQETILFNGAKGELWNRFELTGSAQLMAWDIICLGRRASGETFDSGEVKQRLEIYRDGKPVFIDRIHFVGASEMLSAPWGMAGEPVCGTFLITVDPRLELSMDALREQLPSGPQWGLSRRGEVLIVRYLGVSAEQCRRGFEAIWRQLRPLLLQREAIRPRIWNT